MGDDGCGGVCVGGLGDVFEVGLWCDFEEVWPAGLFGGFGCDALESFEFGLSWVYDCSCGLEWCPCGCAELAEGVYELVGVVGLWGWGVDVEVWVWWRGEG